MIRLFIKASLILLVALFVFRSVAGVTHRLHMQYSWMRPSKPLF